jgi:hypothetical protein
MSRISVSLALFAVVIAGAFYLYGHETDGVTCDQTCLAEAAEEP